MFALAPSTPYHPFPAHTSVKEDPDELAVIMRLMRQAIEAQLRNPTFHYSTRFKEILFGNHYYFKSATVEVRD